MLISKEFSKKKRKFDVAQRECDKITNTKK